MSSYTIRDREIIIACAAMRVFWHAIQAAQSDWDREDLQIASRLLQKLERAREETRQKYRLGHAASNDRR